VIPEPGYRLITRAKCSRDTAFKLRGDTQQRSSRRIDGSHIHRRVRMLDAISIANSRASQPTMVTAHRPVICPRRQGCWRGSGPDRHEWLDDLPSGRAHPPPLPGDHNVSEQVAFERKHVKAREFVSGSTRRSEMVCWTGEKSWSTQTAASAGMDRRPLDPACTLPHPECAATLKRACRWNVVATRRKPIHEGAST
jgi:hypothetical protein